MSDTAMSTGYMTPQELKEQERAAKKAERARLKRVEMDEKAERKRAAKSGFANVSNPRATATANGTAATVCASISRA